MKKSLIMLVVLMLVVSITECTKGKDDRGSNSSSDSNISISQPQDESGNSADNNGSEQAGAELGVATEATDIINGLGK